MDTWLKATFTKDKFTATHDTICQALMSRCGAVVEPQLSGAVAYHISQAGTKQLTQANILTLQQDVDMTLEGKLFEAYYMIVPSSVASANMPEGFPDRTYLDEEGVEVIRKVQDYIAWYQVSTDGLTALLRCTHKMTNESTSGVALDPDNFKLWYDIAQTFPEHIAICPDGLIESTQATELLAGDYAGAGE